MSHRAQIGAELVELLFVDAVDRHFVAIETVRDIFDRMGGRAEFDLAVTDAVTSDRARGEVVIELTAKGRGLVTRIIPFAQQLEHAAAAGIPELMSPAEAAQILGVSEADVIASVDAGDLKAALRAQFHPAAD